MSVSDYTIDDARHYGFGLLGLYKLWHWNNWKEGVRYDMEEELVKEYAERLRLKED